MSRHEYSTDFGLFRLNQTLLELAVDTPTQSNLIDWYWQNADQWAQSCASQLEFDAVAKTHLAAKAQSLAVEGCHSELRRAIRRGLSTSINGRLRHRDTQIRDDAEQDAWLRLLRSATVDGRDANIAGRSAGRDFARKTLREVPASQLDLPDQDPDDSAPEDERDKRLPWEDFKFIVNYFANSRRGRFGKREQNRARDIYAKLRRRLTD
jgi:hypothetical protein